MQKCINDNSLIQNEDHMGNLPWAKGREGIHSPCSQPHPLRILSETPSRNNMTPWGAMMTNTYNGLRCGSKGIKMWMSWRIYSIPKARSWASNIWKNVVPQLFAQIHPGGNKVPRHPPHLVQRTGMLPRLSKNLNKISETLDLWIRSIGNVPPNQRTKNKTKARLPKQLVEAASEEQHHEAKEGHKEVSYIRLHSQHKWVSGQAIIGGRVEGLWVTCMFGLWDRIRQGEWQRQADYRCEAQCHCGHHQDLVETPKIQRRGSDSSITRCGWRVPRCNSLSIARAKRTSFQQRS